jgi:hypothetical protein
MRIAKVILLALVVALSSCSKKTTIIKKSPTSQTKKMIPPGQIKKQSAPGQVKKTTGSKSAAPYAPGQQKKSSSSNGKSTPKKK